MARQVLVRTGSDDVSTVTLDAPTRVRKQFRIGSDIAGNPPPPPTVPIMVGRPVRVVFATRTGGVIEDEAQTSLFAKRTAGDLLTPSTSDLPITNRLTNRTAQDSAPATDSATRLVLPYQRPVEELVDDVEDVASRILLPAKRGPPTPDSAPASDAATQKRVVTRSAPDTVTPTDQATRLTVYSRTAADTAPATDDGARRGDRFRSGIDSVVGLTDTATRQPVFKRSGTDSISATLADAVTRAPVFRRTASDTAPISADAATKVRKTFATAADVVTPGTADTATRLPTFKRSAVDPLTSSSDSPASLAKHPRTGSDTVAAPVDAVLDTATLKRSAADAVTPTETPTSFALHPRTGSDTADAADALTTLILRRATAADTAPASDGETHLAALLRTSQDTASASDDVQSYALQPRTGDDNAPADDTLASPSTRSRTATDALAAVTDALTSLALHPRTGQDTAPATDDGTRLGNRYRAGSDTLAAPTDAASGNRVAAVRSVSDPITGLTDAAVKVRKTLRTSSDSITANDAVSKQALIRRNLAEDSALYLTGRSGSGAVIFQADATHMDVPGDLEVSLDLAPDQTWAAGVGNYRNLLTRWGPAGSRQWAFLLTPTGSLHLAGTTNGSTQIDWIGSVVVPFVAGQRGQVKVTLTANNGAAQSVVRFYTRLRDADPWVLLETVTRAGAVALWTGGTAHLGIGLLQDADVYSAFNWPGRIFKGEVRNGIGGPVVASLDFTSAAPSTHNHSVDGGVTVYGNVAVYNTSSVQGAAYPRDVGTQKRLLPRTGNDTAGGISEVATRLAVLRRTGTDTAESADALLALALHPRTASDTAPVTDDLTSLTVHPRTADDTGTLDDVVSRTVTNPRTADDTAGASDALAWQASHFRTGSDSAPVTDTAASLSSHPRTADDTTVTGDAVNHLVKRFGVAVDTAPATDAATARGSRARTASDNAPASDTLATPTTQRRTGADAAGAADVLTSLTKHPRSASDSTTLSEALTSFSTHPRTTQDTAPATDDGTRRGDRYRTGADTVAGISDAAVRAPIYRRTGTDTATTADVATRSSLRSRTATDIASVTDVAVRASLFKRSGVDSVSGAADVPARQANILWSRTTSDTAPATDLATRKATLPRLALDLGGTPLSRPYSGGLVQDPFHPVFAERSTQPYVGDAAVWLLSTAASGFDTLTVATDSAARTLTFKRTAADAAGASDTPTSFARHFRSSLDEANFTRAPYVGLVRPLHFPLRATGEGLTDDVGRFQMLTRRLSVDTAGATDAALGKVMRGRFALDSVAGANDNLDRAIVLRRSVTDDADVYDLAKRKDLASRSSGDTVAVPTDAITLWFGLRRSATDSAPATDAVSRPGILYRRTSSDTAAASDSTSRTVLAKRSSVDQGNYTKGKTFGLVRPLVTPLTTPGEGLTDDTTRFLVLWRRLSVDTAAAADQAVKNVLRPRTGADTAPASDAATRVVIVSRAASDDGDVEQDAAKRKALPKRSSADTLPQPTDAVSLVQGLARFATDSTSTSDVAVASPLYRRSGLDTATASDSAVRTVLAKRSSLDQGNYTRGVFFGLVRRLVVPLRTIGHGLTDDAARALVLYRRLSDDSGAANDSLVHIARHIRFVAETVGTADALSRLLLAFRRADDDVDTYDILRAGRFFVRRGADSAPASDAALRKPIFFQRSSADLAPAADDGTRRGDRYRTATDSARLWDSHREEDVPSLVRPLVSPLGSGHPDEDNAERQVSYRRGPQDSAPASDLLQFVHLRKRTGTDSAPASDQATRSIDLRRSVRDDGNSVEGQPYVGLVRPLVWTLNPPSNPSVDDAVRVVFLYRRGGDDAAVAHDSASRKVLGKRSALDIVLAPSDSVTRLQNLDRERVDLTTTSDAALRSILVRRGGSDSGPVVTDEASRLHKPGRYGTDSAPAVDSAVRAIVLRRATTDVTVVSDEAFRLGLLPRTAADSAQSADAPSSFARHFRTASEAFSAGDAAVRVLLTHRYGTEAAPSGDAAYRAIDLVRASLDSLPSPADWARQRATLPRTGLDVAPATDQALRTAFLPRRGADFASAADVVDRQRTMRKGATDNAPATDTLAREVLAKRQALDLALATDTALRLHLHFRNLTELLGTGDAGVRRILAVRRAIDPYFNSPEDGNVRKVWLWRSSQDEAWANDAGRGLWTQFLYEVLPPVTDEVARFVFKARTGFDVAPAQDNFEARRVIYLGRSAPDAAPASDSTSHDLRYLRASQDQIGGADDFIVRSSKALRSGFDDAPTFDAATRWKAASRQAFDVTSTGDDALLLTIHRRAVLDSLPVLGDLVQHDTHLVRRAFDRVLRPADAGWWLQTHHVAFGPPVADLTHVSKIKVGAEPGCDTVDIAFEFDQPITAWTVRVNSTGPFDGTGAASWEQPAEGFGRQAFGTSPFGQAVEDTSISSGEATLYAADLLHGANKVVVYGRGLNSLWSHHPTGSLMATASSGERRTPSAE